jgi:hypothetical protein
MQNIVFFSFAQKSFYEKSHHSLKSKLSTKTMSLLVGLYAPVLPPFVEHYFRNQVQLNQNTQQQQQKEVLKAVKPPSEQMLRFGRSPPLLEYTSVSESVLCTTPVQTTYTSNFLFPSHSKNNNNDFSLSCSRNFHLNAWKRKHFLVKQTKDYSNIC